MEEKSTSLDNIRTILEWLERNYILVMRRAYLVEET